MEVQISLGMSLGRKENKHYWNDLRVTTKREVIAMKERRMNELIWEYSDRKSWLKERHKLQACECQLQLLVSCLYTQALVGKRASIKKTSYFTINQCPK